MPQLGLGLGLHRANRALFRGLLDQYAGAAAAYSLRALSSGWLAGDVVEVRSSSGWTPASFTANQVANGEMVDYVKRPGNFTNIGFETFANNGTGDGFAATNSASFGTVSAPVVSGIATDTVTIEFDLSIVSGSPSVSLRLDGGAPVSNLETYTTSGSKAIVLTATGNFNNFTFSEGDIPSEFTVSNVRVSTNDGFVSKWYDQSGNGNDAIQATTTAQPKIVSAGSLVTGGLDFDGVDDYLQLVGDLGLSGDDIPKSYFAAATASASTASLNIVSLGSSLSDNQFSVLGATDKYRFVERDDAGVPSVLEGGSFVNKASIITGISNGTTRSVYGGGAFISSESTSLGQMTFDTFTIGALGRIAEVNFWDAPIQEVIIYNSDQSANRVAIETNINDHYSIYA